MKVSIIFAGLLLAFCLCQSVTPTQAARSDALLKLLDDILKKMDAFQTSQGKRLKKLSSAHAKDVRESDKELARLKAMYEKEKANNNVLKDEQQKEQDAGAAAMLKMEQTYQKEKRLILKIKNMLTHELGTDKEHPAKNCQEIFLDLTAQSGTYWLIDNGKAAQKRCVRAGDNQAMWAGGCSQSDRGKKGWALLCLDEEETNSAQKFLRTQGSNQLEVLQAGLYNIKAHVQNYCSGRCGRSQRVMINGKSIDYMHWSNGYHTVTQTNDVTWSLKKGDKISLSVYGSGSDIWRWKSKKEGESRNRLQVSFVGDVSEEVFFSGGCSGHKRSSGWQQLCLNSIEYNSAETKKHLDFYKDGRIIVKKAGYYRIASSVMSHSNGGYHYLRITVNGANREYCYSYNNGWTQQLVDMTYPLKQDDVIIIYSHVSGGNPYNWHSHSTGGGHTARMQIQKISDISGDQRVKMIQGGPSSHHRSKSWFQYSLSRVATNTMPASVITYKSNGNIYVKKNTWVRINAIAQSHVNGNAPRYGKITVNGDVVHTYELHHEHTWQMLSMDHTFPAVKGDVIKVYWRSQGGNPYVHLFSSPNGEGLLEVFAL